MLGQGLLPNSRVGRAFQGIMIVEKAYFLEIGMVGGNEWGCAIPEPQVLADSVFKTCDLWEL